MTPERDDMNERLRQKRAQRQKERELRQRQQRQAMLRLMLVVAAMVLAAALIVWASITAPDPAATQPGESIVQTTSASSTETAAAEQTQEVTATEPTTVIHIAAAGDLNVTDAVINNNTSFAGFDFTNAFLDVAPVLAAADLSIVNFEGTLAGAPYGGETASAPAALAEALAAAGVDVVQTANSASIRSGVLGLQSTLAGLNNAGLISVGTFADGDAFRQSEGFTMVEVEGIRIALVAFTKGMDNLGLPEGSENCVNLLYEDYTTDYKEIDTDGITRILRNVAAAEPDLTIALLHWGSEYNENISDSQEDIQELMMKNGVDAIIGTHSHLLQAIEYDQNEGTLVAWSLGDFYGDAQEAGSNYSVILDLEITLDNTTGLTSITGYSVTPIYTLKPEQSVAGGQRVVRIEKAMARYEGGYLGRVTESTYASMEKALSRIEKRITPEEA